MNLSDVVNSMDVLRGVVAAASVMLVFWCNVGGYAGARRPLTNGITRGYWIRAPIGTLRERGETYESPRPREQ